MLVRCSGRAPDAMARRAAHEGNEALRAGLARASPAVQTITTAAKRGPAAVDHLVEFRLAQCWN
jgi:hypothetical protein